MMPVMDGFDFLIQKYNNEDWRSVPVVAVTAKDLTKEEEMLISGRVEQVFHKDLDSLQDLTEIVQHLTKPTQTEQTS
jgi:CheY-like chemotaxis protein